MSVFAIDTDDLDEMVKLSLQVLFVPGGIYDLLLEHLNKDSKEIHEIRLDQTADQVAMQYAEKRGYLMAFGEIVATLDDIRQYTIVNIDMKKLDTLIAYSVSAMATRERNGR